MKDDDDGAGEGTDERTGDVDSDDGTRRDGRTEDDDMTTAATGHNGTGGQRADDDGTD